MLSNNASVDDGERGVDYPKHARRSVLSNPNMVGENSDLSPASNIQYDDDNVKGLINCIVGGHDNINIMNNYLADGM